jgi:uncharacterized protein YqeY
MRADLRRDLSAALKSRDRAAIGALRSALAALENAEAVPADSSGSTGASSEHVAGTVEHGAAEAPRRHLTEAEVRAVVEAEVHDRRSAALEYEQLGRGDHAVRLRAEADVLARYLS